jgi:hypothetical protein
MDDSIALVVDLFRRFQNLDDDQILTRLCEEGMDNDLAQRLLTFIPMVYVRILLEKSPVQFPDMYEVDFSQEDRRETRRLSDEPSWLPIFAYARAETSRGISSGDLLAVAGRSAEFDAINKALNAGCELEHARLANLRVGW